MNATMAATMDELLPFSMEVGPDGFYVDPRHPSNRLTAEQWAAHRHAQEMVACERAWRAGSIRAVARAIHASVRFQMPPWPWLDEACASLVGQRMTEAEKREERELAIHRIRHDAVDEYLARNNELAALHAHPLSEAKKAGITFDPFDFYPSQEAAFENVATLFRGKPEEGEASSIKRSFQLIKKRRRSGLG